MRKDWNIWDQILQAISVLDEKLTIFSFNHGRKIKIRLKILV